MLGRVVAVVSLSLGLVTDSARATTIHATGEFELTPAERTKVQALACSAPYGVGIDTATGYVWPSGVRTVRIRCLPHMNYRGRPVFATTECTPHGRKWTCEPSSLNLVFDDPGLPSSIMVAGPTLEEASSIVDYLMTLPTYEGGRVSGEELRSLWLLQTREVGKVEAYVDGSLLYLARKCSGGQCTYSVTGSALVDR